MPSQMNLFFATDLHGSEAAFHRFLAAGRKSDMDCLFLGGDLVGKRLVPVRRRATRGFEALTRTGLLELSSLADLSRLELELARRGAYLMVVDDPAALSSEERETILIEAAGRRLERWLAEAETILSPRGLKLVAIPGNDDPPFVDELLDGCPVVENVDGRCLEIGQGLIVAGLGCSTPTPWNTYREVEDHVLRARLAEILDGVPEGSGLVLHVHVPPHGILDKISGPRRSPTLGPGRSRGRSVGSRAVRELVERRQPVLGLFGHVHECRGAARAGNTLCVNPGSASEEGRLLGAEITLNGPEVVSWRLTEDPIGSGRG